MYQTTTHELGHNLGAKDANIIGYTTECGAILAMFVMCQDKKVAVFGFVKIN